MIRLFRNHEVRYQQELEGMWEFEPLKGDTIPKEFNYSMAVPGCWEQHPSFSAYRGKAAYRRYFQLQGKENIRLEFKGVSHTADVFIDGTKIAHHYNAYTPFSMVAAGLEAGKHELLVIADNSFSEKSALHVPNDYYTYGGIIRPVAVEYVKDTFIERIRFTPRYTENHWEAEISLIIRNISDKNITVDIKGILADNHLDFGSVTIPESGEIAVTKTFNFNHIKSWSSESPNLYLLNINLLDIDTHQSVDDLIERVGFRVIRISGHKIILNDKEIFLKGFCRHEDYGLFGCAIPVQLMAKDIELILGANANTVRTSHYPNDERFLDLCDERGIYVFEENHARGIGLEGMKNKNFELQCEACNEEMVHSHFNHPSILIWGILNECASDTPEGRTMYEKQINQIKMMDQSRPLTFATCQHYKDLCLDLADIISLNVYSRWYNDRSPEEDFAKLYDWVNKNGGSQKPILISEFGGEGLYGNHSNDRLYWSEEAQSDLIEEALKVYLNTDAINGTLIWQFCDNRVTDGYFRTMRPGMTNNKGVVDLLRRPKLSYATVKQYYKNKN